MTRRWLGAVVVMVAACTDIPPRPSEVLQENFRRQCDRFHACRAAWDPTMQGGATFESTFGADREECFAIFVGLVEQFAPDYFEDVDAAVADGRILFNEADSETCLAALEQATCDELFHQNGASREAPMACETALEGQVAPGGACTISDECADEKVCEVGTHTCNP
jgi:hypothetical protein